MRRPKIMHYLALSCVAQKSLSQQTLCRRSPLKKKCAHLGSLRIVHISDGATRCSTPQRTATQCNTPANSPSIFRKPANRCQLIVLFKYQTWNFPRHDWECIYIYIYIRISIYIYTVSHVTVGTIDLGTNSSEPTSECEYCLFYRALLQKRPIILRRLWHKFVWTHKWVWILSVV